MLVTAVVTTFERPLHLRRALRSVRAQTYGPLHIVVVEDGSDTGIQSWLRQESLDRVTYLRHPENRGLAAARNTGLEAAEGDYVAYLDDDDEWRPQRIERQMLRLGELSSAERARVGVVYCGVEVRAAGRGQIVMLPRNRGNLREAIIREGAATLPSTCLFPRDMLRDVGGFDERLPSSIDHDIWMALATHGYEALAIDEPLVVTYPSAGERLTTRTASRIRGVRLYLDKWLPTYREWHGRDRGEDRARQYFTTVIGRLAADKLVRAQFREAWQATRAVMEYDGRSALSLGPVLGYTARAAAGRVMPWSMLKLLRGDAERRG